MPIDLLSPLFTSWIRLLEPNLDVPCWHEPDGTPHTVSELRVGVGAAKAAEIEQLHAESVSRLVIAAAEASRRGDHNEARRHASAASRLCEELVGLWPTSSRSVGR